MSVLQFHSPPLPHFTMGGEDTYAIGRTHLSRNNIGLFDLLIVTQGSLYIAEEDKEYDVTPGKALILRPDLYHCSYKPCTSRTHFYWLHFQTIGRWQEISNEHKTVYKPPDDPYNPISFFNIYLPRFCALSNPWKTHQNVVRLLEMQETASELWEQQVIFQEIIMDLNSKQMELWNSQSFQLAEKTAVFLRQNFQSPIHNETLKQHLHFHPTYLTRCMKQVYGCTPLEYLTELRIRQARTLLIRTDMSVSIIAQNVGFNSSTYFIRCFVQAENITPYAYRKKFR
jgi:AraC-like DNA-binding protein